MKRLRLALLVLILIALPAGIYAAVSHGGPDEAQDEVRTGPDSRAPEGVRIRVEVLNASSVQGLARSATFFLRERGFDVVESGNSAEKHDSTIVLDRSHHPEWARLVANAMGNVPVAEAPDSTHYVDVTVLVGPSWRPPPKPFHP
ncbi:MAG TPA: LytR C-terminal domain-containing protein [Gemmatimonadaceae bacterium]|nr:LytR C-terminal domain-containing protein [Gemmatimonadaceae bacterium]